MKSEKSKGTKTTVESIVATKPISTISYFLNKKDKPKQLLSEKELRLQTEEKKRNRHEFFVNIKKGIGKFFTILFILAVIFSMIVVPLLIVFG